AAGSTRDPEIRRSLGELGLLDEVQVVGGQASCLGDRYNGAFSLDQPTLSDQIRHQYWPGDSAACRSHSGRDVLRSGTTRSLSACQNSRADQRQRTPMKELPNFLETSK